MINQIILLTIILAPCVAFVAGALLFSLVSVLRDTLATHAHHSSGKSHGLSYHPTIRLDR